MSASVKRKESVASLGVKINETVKVHIALMKAQMNAEIEKSLLVFFVSDVSLDDACIPNAF